MVASHKVATARSLAFDDPMPASIKFQQWRTVWIRNLPPPIADNTERVASQVAEFHGFASLAFVHSPLASAMRTFPVFVTQIWMSCFGVSTRNTTHPFLESEQQRVIFAEPQLNPYCVCAKWIGSLTAWPPWL
jgi:hypothetical protein